jgi:hypothetical protein
MKTAEPNNALLFADNREFPGDFHPLTKGPRSLADPKLGEFSLDRMFRAVERVRERLLRPTAALDRAEVHYAVIADSAYMEWIARADVSGVRYTKDVSILIRRGDLDWAARELQCASFVGVDSPNPQMFLDRQGASKRDTVRIVLAADTIPDNGELAATDIAQATRCEQFHIVPFESLVRVSRR